MKDKVIKSLEKLKNKVNDQDFNLTVWKGNAINIIRRVYGGKSSQEDQIKQIKFKAWATGGIAVSGRHGEVSMPIKAHDNLETCKKQAKQIIESIIDEIEAFGLPEKEEKTDTSLLKLNVSQQQSMDVKFLIATIYDKLEPNQKLAIDDILKSDDIKKEKRKKLIGELKSFGSELLAKIISEVLLKGLTS